MANYIDISAQLENAKPGLIIAPGEAYEIDDRKNTIIKVQALFNKSDSDKEDDGYSSMTKALDLLLGKLAIKEINEKHPGILDSISTLRVIYSAVMAAVSGDSYEAVESRFREA